MAGDVPFSSVATTTRRLPGRARGAALAVAAATCSLAMLTSSSGAATGLAKLSPASTASVSHVSTPAAVCQPRVAAAAKKGATTCLGWSVRDTWAGHEPVVALLTFHPLGQPAGIDAYAGWMRTSATVLGLFLGYEGPGVTTLPRGPEEVPATGVARLLATFNSGFYEKDSPEGFYTNHTLYFPMVKGQATVVRYTNGTVGITQWEGGPNPGPSVLMARQNLPLLVNDSLATAATNDNAAWGITLHGVPDVWRSALGIDKNGNLIYAAAPDQTAASMASIMVQLHCVRAMQLDINPEWPIFVTYGGPGARTPTLDVPNPNQIPDRFLYTSTKDFFALFLSTGPGVPQPW